MSGLPIASAPDYVAQGQAAWQATVRATQSGKLRDVLGAATLIAQDMPPGQVSQAISDMVNDASVGAGLGSVLPGYGTVIGAAIGALIGLVSAIFGQGVPSDDRPAWLKWTEEIPFPHNQDGSPSTAMQVQLAGEWFEWWQAKNLAGKYGSSGPVPEGFRTWAAAQVVNASLAPGGQTGKIVIDSGLLGVDFEETYQRWGRWTIGSPVFLPAGYGDVEGGNIRQGDDQFGWWLNRAFWQLAVQGNDDLAAYHFALMCKWVMVHGGGPAAEAHLDYLIGYLKSLQSARTGIVSVNPVPVSKLALSGNLHLVAVSPVPGSPGVSAGAALGLGALALLFFL